MTLSLPLAPRAGRRLLLVAATFAVLAALCAQAFAAAARGGAWSAPRTAVIDPGIARAGSAQHVVVQAAPGQVADAAAAVRSAGGTVGVSLPIIDGFAATLPASAVGRLSNAASIRAVTANRQAHFSEMSYDDTTTASSGPKATQATAVWSRGFLGQGVGVAIIDTGVSSMPDFAGRVVYGPDLSGEGTTVDSYGHGTVMAGLAAGSGADSAGNVGGAYTGTAPKATIVAVKTAGRNGATDVTTVLQAMHWVAAYKDQFNIRVVNLSLGFPSTQDPAVDPLNFAVERLWRAGIFVVVAAGNTGPNNGSVQKPGDDPLVLTVGAYDDKGDADANNDQIPAWSSRGPTAQGLVKPDISSPGRTLIAARSYGSYVEEMNPKALIGKSYIKGSGTSEAAAVVSGVAALLVQAHPAWTPDQLKAALKSTALPINGKLGNDQGTGRLLASRAVDADVSTAPTQTFAGSGLGSIEATRGGRNVQTVCPGQSSATLIQGEIDVRCEPWNGSAWTGSAWTGSAWTGSAWTNSTWTGSAWTGGTWTGSAWTGSAWTGSAWTGSAWTGSAWTGSAWTTTAYQGSAWTGSAWTSSGYGELDDVFLTAFWGNKPKFGKKVAGEQNDAPEPGTKCPAAPCPR
ncbi:MAG: S8 family serine peptidase [Mycobacteriales bacterium]